MMKHCFLLCLFLSVFAFAKGQDSLSRQESDSLSVILDRPGSFVEETASDTIVCSHCKFPAIFTRINYFFDNITKQLVKIEEETKFISEKTIYQHTGTDSVILQNFYFINQRLFKGLSEGSVAGKIVQKDIYYFSGNKMEVEQYNGKSWASLDERERLNYRAGLLMKKYRR